VHGRRFGKADCPAYQPLDPRAQVDVLTLNFLGMLFANLMLLSVEVPHIGAPIWSKNSKPA
jgi:hypothetical protein